MGARRLERLEQLAKEIEAGGGQALAIAADLARLDDIHNLVNRALHQYGQIDVLFNNAGFGRLDWLENLDPLRDIEDQLRVNLIALIETTQAVLPHMIARRSGHIVNMSSIAGLGAAPTYSVYSASKFAVRGFSEALRREVGVYGIRVSVIYPGGVRTEFAERAKIKRKTRKTTPASLRLDPEQVAQAVLDVVRRPRRGVILPLLTTTMAILWTIGIMAIGGFEMSMISSDIPVILLAVWLSIGRHFHDGPPLWGIDFVV